MGTVVVGTILVIIVALIIRKLIKDKRNGGVCDGNCGSYGCGCGK